MPRRTSSTHGGEITGCVNERNDRRKDLRRDGSPANRVELRVQPTQRHSTGICRQCSDFDQLVHDHLRVDVAQQRIELSVLPTGVEGAEFGCPAPEPARINSVLSGALGHRRHAVRSLKSPQEIPQRSPDFEKEAEKI
eukprot:TRINITY_DN5227_c0_g1_i2.p2 TRINITY_DN5227_c0_g1~~TRINITY_DN5227_c0_g1_i2.p2  ORF type:complete len:138 (+),score=17.77 TRINITY_DN5227_c0_g1_i2:474-887(+)